LHNPQTFNRYTYALNNPLRFIDPLGLEVPPECAFNPSCTIVIRVRVIYDRDLNLSKGAKARFEREQLDVARRALGLHNIQLDVTYVEGTFETEGGVSASPLDPAAWNLVVTNGVKEGASGVTPSGIAISAVRADRSNSIFSDAAHEFGHQALGHRQTPVRTVGDLFLKQAKNLVYDALVFQAIVDNDVFSVPFLRMGVAPRVYAIPLNSTERTPKP
jgi:hypothetical protein